MNQAASVRDGSNGVLALARPPLLPAALEVRISRAIDLAHRFIKHAEPEQLVGTLI